MFMIENENIEIEFSKQLHASRPVFCHQYCFVGENLDKYIHVNVTLLLKYIGLIYQ